MNFWFKDRNRDLLLKGFVLTHPIRHDLVIPAHRSVPMEVAQSTTKVPTSSNSFVSIVLQVVNPNSKAYSYKGFFIQHSTNLLW